MHKQFWLTVTLLCLTNFIASAQVKFSTTAKPVIKPDEEVFHYDSTKNFPGERVKELKGQELYVIPLRPQSRKFGYSDFYKTYGASAGYWSSGELKTYELYAGHTFIVEEILPEPKHTTTKNPARSILKLRDKETDSIYYFGYKSTYHYLYPFITMGFYEKEKKNCLGKHMVLKPGLNWRKSFSDRKEPLYDFKTGQEVKPDPNDIWTIEDLTVEDQYYTLSYVIRNAKGETLTVGINDVNNFSRRAFVGALFLDDTLKAVKEKQPEFYQAIMQSEVMTGMTTNMVRRAWGDPEQINETSYGTTWLYNGATLYIKDGKVVSFY